MPAKWQTQVEESGTAKLDSQKELQPNPRLSHSPAEHGISSLYVMPETTSINANKIHVCCMKLQQCSTDSGASKPCSQQCQPHPVLSNGNFTAVTLHPNQLGVMHEDECQLSHAYLQPQSRQGSCPQGTACSRRGSAAGHRACCRSQTSSQTPPPPDAARPCLACWGW